MNTRELDARVAREVMGREVETRTHDGQEYLFEFVKAEREGYRLLDQLLPAYSEDMNAAMEVVTAVIAKLGGTIEMILEDGGWWVVFKVRPGCWHGWKDESLSCAICLAALEAVTNKDKE